MRLYFSLAAIPALLIGCAETTGQSADPGQRSASKIALMYDCVDRHASVAVAIGYNPSIAFDAVQPFCEDEISAYVSELIEKTKRQNNWRSVQPSVPPTVRRNVVAKMKNRMVPVYEQFQAKG